MWLCCSPNRENTLEKQFMFDWFCAERLRKHLLISALKFGLQCVRCEYEGDRCFDPAAVAARISLLFCRFLNAHPPSLPYMIISDPWPLFNSVNMTVFIQQICSRRVGSTCSEQADAGKLSPPAWFKETFTVSISPPPLLHPHLISYIKCFTFSVWKLSGYRSSSCSLTSASCLRWIGWRCTLVGFWPHKWDCTRVIFW